MIIKLNGKSPKEPYYLSENAVLIGDVRCFEMSSVWFGTVLRGDINYISIGKYSNVQDLSVGHVTETLPLIIGDYVTIGHGVILHGCSIGSYSLIGMGSTILDGAVIGEGCIIAAGTVIKENAVIEPFSLVAGVPGVFKKKLPESTVEMLKEHAVSYCRYAEAMKKGSE